AVALGDAEPSRPRWQAAAPAAPTTTPASSAPASPTAAPVPVISLSATGDIVLGNAPDRLPPRGGRGFFDAVRPALAADLVMGNLEEPLTDDTGVDKCAPPRPPSATASAGASPSRAARPSGCHQFRAPPGYAAHLRAGGFQLLNQANNHAYDYGAAGYRNTQRALERHGLRHTGAPGQVTVVEVRGVRVAVLGFSAYYWSNLVTDLGAARRLVRRAAAQADLVVVQVHMGAEGATRTRVRPGTEMFLGENRGDPIAFARAVVDAGADLVVGHGPHVMRALEFYKGRLIAYSLGNFAGGGGTLSRAGPLGWGAVLKVWLRADGTWERGEFISTYMNDSGLPTPDPQRRGLELVRDLCRKDMPRTGPRLGRDGTISPPTPPGSPGPTGASPTQPG
ncbi:MAG TPA: CapA family protein, partial [Pilimelia sp.]|nr:CapA family protein [Pilimelia sp.]